MRALEQAAETAAHWSERDYDALFAPEGPRRSALVAVDGDEVICGFAIARCADEEWEIENVVVAEACRRVGIGGSLTRELLRAAGENGASVVLLEVRESNVAARELYERAGFVIVGRRAEYYRDPPETALIMRRLVSVS